MPSGDLDEVVAAVLGERRCPGAVVTVARDGAHRTFAVGSEACDSARPTDAGGLFEIGSITKVLVATLVLQHVARGDIELDDPVHARIPEFRLADADATNQVTIRHLLTHASDLDAADDFTDTGSEDDCVAKYVAAAVAGSSLLHAVGERWSYCNAGFVVLGRLVEVLDGRPWDVALEERIFRPCGMDAVGRRLLSPDRVVAIGHRVDPVTGAVERATRPMPASVGPAGNVVATTEALLRFVEHLFGGTDELLPNILVAEMLTPQISVRDTSQGLGWALATAPVLVASHGGSTIGFTAFLGVLPSLASALAVLANGPGAGAIARAVYEHLSSTPVTPPPAAPRAVDTADDIARVVGRYARRHLVQDIELADGRLLARSTFQGPAAELFPQPPIAQLEPLGGLRFASRHPFEPDPSLWDFDDRNTDGRSTRLFTQRVHVRVPSS